MSMGLDASWQRRSADTSVCRHQLGIKAVDTHQPVGRAGQPPKPTVLQALDGNAVTCMNVSTDCSPDTYRGMIMLSSRS